MSSRCPSQLLVDFSIPDGWWACIHLLGLTRLALLVDRHPRLVRVILDLWRVAELRSLQSRHLELDAIGGLNVYFDFDMVEQRSHCLLLGLFKEAYLILVRDVALSWV